MKRMLGLTGAYCSGKNTAARLLETRGWNCIDVDKLGHEALARTILPVSRLLGSEVLKADGSPDRKAIAGKVFGDPDLLARYEAIVHPVMLALLDEAIERSPKEKVCVNAAILYRLPQSLRCEGILEVRSPLLVRLLRGMRRDKQSFKAVLAKIHAQRKLFAQKPESVPVVMVANLGPTTRLARNIGKALEKLGLLI